MSAPRTALEDWRWLAEFCLARIGFALVFTIYSATLPLLMIEWKMTGSQAGLIQSAWLGGQVISLFSIGFLSDRYGAKRVYLVGSFAASASAMLFAFFADGFLSALLLYGFTSICSGASYTPGLTIISHRYAAARGQAMGFFLSAASVGSVLSLLMAGLLAPSIGWRGAFIAAACGPVVGTLIAFHALRATPNILHPPAAGGATSHPVRDIFRNRPAMLTIWGYTFHNWELSGLKAWLPAFLAASAYAGGSSAVNAAALGAMLTSITYVASALGGVTGGSLSDRYGRTRTVLLAGCASLACSFVFGWLLGLPLWLLVVFACVYVFAAIADSSVYSTALTELVPARMIGAAFSVRSLLGFTLGALAPWAFGAALDLGRGMQASEALTWGIAWCCLGLGALPGPFMAMQLRRRPEAKTLAGGRM